MFTGQILWGVLHWDLPGQTPCELHRAADQEPWTKQIALRTLPPAIVLQMVAQLRFQLLRVIPLMVMQSVTLLLQIRMQVTAGSKSSKCMSGSLPAACPTEQNCQTESLLPMQ